VSLLPLIIIIGLTLVISLLTHSRWRSWSLLVASILVIYWLQPSTPIRHLDFWLPTACLGLSIFGWVITSQRDAIFARTNVLAEVVIFALVLLLGAMRYLDPICCLTPTRPPELGQIFIAVAIISACSFFLSRFGQGRVGWLYGLSILILGFFVILKSEPLARLASMGLRSINAQSVSLATGLDIRWLGFSYVAFRLLHTLRDRLSGRLPGMTLQEYVIYVIFYPAFTAGPIDRIQRFVVDLHQPEKFSAERALQGGRRILMGIFSKFVLADGLALLALNSINADQVISTGWLWIMLYAYAMRIYFDFSGYTNIAIGLGHLLGIQLPENFERPYLKTNLTLFWNSWHMTLANWFRAYFFNPLTRALRSRPKSLPFPFIIFIGQLSTFILIGLWHGISWNFAIWGAWHGLGLFIHNRWSELMRSKSLSIEAHPRLKGLVSVMGVVITFNYVSLGWVWFVLSKPDQSWKTLLKLFGVG